MADKIRWGILGCGAIAHSFVKALTALPEARLAAVASRTPGKAEAFAKQYGAGAWFTEYTPLAESPDVDIIYVATTHNLHHDNVRLCLDRGKHVLCEKPFTVNERQALELFALAKRKKRFLMEAVWTRFLPGIQDIKAKLAAGVIGDIERLDANFWIQAPYDPAHRLYNKTLAGGALLDLGIYPLTFADIVFAGERPAEVTTRARLGRTGVDEASYYYLRYASGARAQLSSSCRAAAPIDAVIVGTKGCMHVPRFFFLQDYSIHLADNSQLPLKFPFRINGYEYEAVEAMRCLREELTESPLLTGEKTCAMLHMMDAMRKEWGLAYPGE
jgi:predicted dehydrogenase